MQDIFDGNGVDCYCWRSAGPKHNLPATCGTVSCMQHIVVDDGTLSVNVCSAKITNAGTVCTVHPAEQQRRPCCHLLAALTDKLMQLAYLYTVYIVVTVHLYYC